MIQPTSSNRNIVGELEPTSRRTGAQFLVHQPFAPFVYRFSPMLFDRFALDGKIGDRVLKGDFWLPTPSRISLVPGAANVEQAKEHQDEDAMYASIRLEGTRENGETWIDAKFDDGDDAAPGYVPAAYCPDGVPAGSYRRMARVKIPQRDEVFAHYITPWDVYRVIAPKTPASRSFDHEKYGLWLASLVLRGIVPPVDKAAVDYRISRLKARGRRTEALALPDDVRKQRVGALIRDTERATTAKIVIK
jgi:hypothetical protein